MRRNRAYGVLEAGAFAALISLAFTGEAWAYIDPGTGSLMLQALIGGVAGGLFMIKIYWRRLKDIFAGGRPGQEPSHEGQPED